MMKNAQGSDSRIRAAIRLFRPLHWIKNGLVWLPIFFSARLLQQETFFAAAMAFVSFSLAASAVYIFNDICDAENDRRNPRKCCRPVASGAIPVPTAARLGGLAAAGAILLNLVFVVGRNGSISSLLLLVLYFILNIGYSLRWKNIPLVDIALLSSGFLIRVFYGGEFCRIRTSPWLFLTVLVTALFMGLGKRRSELQEAGGEHRPVLNSYSAEFLAGNMYLAAALGIVFYALWSISVRGGSVEIWTVPLVVFYFIRYGYAIESGKAGGDPVILVLKDLPLLLLGSAIVLLLFVALYGAELCRRWSV